MSAFLPDPDVVAQPMGDDCVLVHLRSNGVFVLNATGWRFWQLLSTRKPTDEIRQRLLDEFDVPPEQLDGEIEELMRRLKELELIVPA